MTGVGPATQCRAGARWTAVTVDCAEPRRLARFWGALLDIPLTDEHGDDEAWATVGSRSASVPRLTFQRVHEPRTTKVRIHLDVEVTDIDSGRQRVIDLGGRWSGIRHDHDEGVVVTMHDPEGNEFCLVQYYD